MLRGRKGGERDGEKKGEREGGRSRGMLGPVESTARIVNPQTPVLAHPSCGPLHTAPPYCSTRTLNFPLSLYKRNSITVLSCQLKSIITDRFVFTRSWSATSDFSSVSVVSLSTAIHTHCCYQQL